MEGLLNNFSFGIRIILKLKYFFAGILCLWSLLFAISCSSGTISTPSTSTHNLIIDLPGKNIVALVDDQGELTRSVQITSEDGKIGLAVDKGTSLLDKDGKILDSIKIAVDSNSITLPDNRELAGLVIDIQPKDGVVNPSLKLGLAYDSTTLAQGVSEKDLWIYWHNGEKWEIMGFKASDTEPNKVTTKINHFGKYSLLAPIRPTPAPLTPLQTGLTSSNLQQALINGKPTLAELGSVSCIPCKQMKPILEQLAVDYQDRLNVVIIDIYDQPKVGNQYKVMAIPTQVVFDRSGKEVARHVGLWPREQIEAQLNKMEIK
jgi:thioredoxin 1